MSQGIWKFGDFEMYHNLQVHNRRQQYGYPEPVVWKMYTPEPVVEFRKEVTTRGGIFRIRARGNFSVSIGDKPWNIKNTVDNRRFHWKQGQLPLQFVWRIWKHFHVFMWMVS